MTVGAQDGLAGTVRRLAAAHAADRGPLLPILHDLQHELGYVPADALPLLARELNLSRAEVYGVMTFYRDFRDAPSGPEVRVCRGEACQAVGAEALMGQAKAHQGRAAIDLDHVFCLGNCGTVHGRVSADRLDALISRAAR
jgi:formate dehydrogenase subunit gamma